ncbi:preprotein translocase subunit SecY [bacterium (Candidatus Gribaldobacteria) CG07_land_8_20_14_0_80_33_18]|uniref:Protein translocase subunit SecY n=1 Tax=bacterium (Candidatus Gribaldobacteria) CG07_land_8_20_14_0_80_33_18 TaxID=2014272 RepID=A0A2M6Z2U6_9BACT|nr:MAG: preprotein translocase subunit SecY [bacterium (Candidatus Gribaldobacteria) CG10_big_fil_rev_8_21_14_0_10_33_41]PIU46739.1 MAG: preprotein translocase subunit SecY [bacterium (Candidatus Gribaldobacteria) CG07_land_8_20_14_0_80_33_18]
MNWFQKFIIILKDKQLRGKILFILLIFAIFRLMANIPIPGINIENLRRFFTENQFFGLLNIFTGGALTNLSIVMLGIGPYITAVIILQLLTMIFPQLEKMYKEGGPEGQRKFNQYGRILTIPLAVLQGYAMLKLFTYRQIVMFSPQSLIVAIITITCGSVFLMWLGELISEKGLGNGVSLLIFAGIVAQTPTEIRQIIFTWDVKNLPAYILFFIAALVIIAGVVLINEAKRNIPVSYAKRVRGTKMYGGVSTYLPININPAGVMPIIFALSILSFPTMIANFLTGSQNQFLANLAFKTSNFFQNQWLHGIFYFILVFVFTYFYTAITFDPKAISENLQKMGGFIPGIRPGNSTAEFLHRILYRVLFIGALFLGVIAIMPSIIQGLTGIKAFQFLIGGTALLILVSVALDTWRQIKAQMEMREYETF